jgi:rhamnosyltransferase
VELSTATRQRLALDRPFMLVIARLEPENNLLAIVQAFRSLPQGAVDLVVVGGTTTPHYRQALAPLAAPHVRFVGGIYEQEVLNELRSNCIAYLHGHSVGGTNPSLLEALASVRGRLICHDNKYNREVAGDEAQYFANELQLATVLKSLNQDTGRSAQPNERKPSRNDRFRPDVIAKQYLELFLSLRPKVVQ